MPASLIQSVVHGGDRTVSTATSVLGADISFNGYPLKVVMPDAPDAALKEFLEKWEAGRAYDPRQAMEQFT